jgi:transposase-like protein
MASLPMRCLIEKVVRNTGAKTVRLTRPAELDLTLTDQAKLVICNHTIEQDHRGVKRITRPMLGFKSFAAAQDTLVGVELMHMIKKKQMVLEEGEEGLTAAELFYSLAA